MEGPVGRHSKESKGKGKHVQIPQQRGARTATMVDAHTHVEHQVTDASAAQHRHSGRYLALCGARVLAASLTDPGRGRCAECAQ